MWLLIANNGGEPVGNRFLDPEHSIDPAKVFCDVWEFLGPYLTSLVNSSERKQTAQWIEQCRKYDNADWEIKSEANRKDKSKRSHDFARRHAQGLADAAKATLPPEPSEEWARVKEGLCAIVETAYTTMHVVCTKQPHTPDLPIDPPTHIQRSRLFLVFGF